MEYVLIYPHIPVPAFVKIITVSMFSFVISWFVTWLMNLNKITPKVIMQLFGDL